MNLKKMKLRLASAALAAVMLTQCVPMNAFAKNGKELEKPELEPIKGYAVQAPREGNNTAEVEIPPTFVEKLQEISAGDRAEKIDSIEALSMPERTVENDRFLARMLHVSSYVDLTSEDASFLCDFLDAEEDSFLLGASYGFSLAESINYLELAKRISCDPETIFIMAPDEERCAMLRRQICLYEAILNPELTGSALDTQLRAQILSGHEAMEVIYAYGVSQALNQEIGYVLDHDSDMVSLMVSGEGIATDSLSQEDLPVRSYLQNKAEKTVDVDLTGSDDFVSSVLTSVREILSVSAQYTNSGEAASGSTRTFINAPYLYQHNQTEKVSLNSGALVYESTDDVLPGVNGLDLVLSRRYNSQEANVYYESAEEAYAFYVLYGWKASYSVPGIGTGPWSYYDQDFVEGPFWTRHEADVFVSHLPSGREGIPDFSDGADLVLNYYATIKRVVDGYSSSCKPNHYFNDLYGLGHGWSLQFSSIENIDGKKYLHLSNGNTYAIDFSSGRSHLKDYTLNDMVMTDHCSAFRVGPTISQYRLTYKDGRREYFDSRGKLIGIQDRYNHKISFSYKQWDSSDLNVVITDTLGRNTTISKQNSENGLLFMFLCQTAIHFNTM